MRFALPFNTQYSFKFIELLIFHANCHLHPQQANPAQDSYHLSGPVVIETGEAGHRNGPVIIETGEVGHRPVVIEAGEAGHFNLCSINIQDTELDR